MRGKIKWLALSLVFIFAAVMVCLQIGVCSAIHDKLVSHLSCVDELPAGKTFDAVYILGGNQQSLKAKFRTVAALYANGRCNEIFILSRPGTTEYSRTLGRNLTNDEWSLMILENLGIPNNQVHTIEVDSGFFGTLSEASVVSRMAKEKGWKELLLITSPHHTKRTGKSFRYFLNATGTTPWVLASNKTTGLAELIVEAFKLQVYQHFLLT
mgnify:CR=1 FL=1